MADSARNISVMSIIPRNWRLLTVAGVATVGLACGIGKPALAELWKQSRPESKTLPAESGFSATIRKLKADSRRAAEQGDQAKAIQLAERAAKISEAAAQVVGPTGECSPEETARFLAETRARRGSVNGIVGQATSKSTVRPSVPAAQQPPAATKVVSTPKPVAAPQVAKTNVAPPVKSSPRPAAPRALAQQPRKTPVVAVTKADPPDLRSRSVGMSFAVQEPTTSHDVAVSDPAPQRPQEARQIAEGKSSESVGDLLVQSRLEAADGNTDLALRLADQAVAQTSHGSLFGRGAKLGEAEEAVQWREHLLAQKQMNGVPVANRKSIAPSAEAPTAAVQVAAVQDDWQSDSTAPVTPLPSIHDDWTEPLPPAPSPQIRRDHEPVQFHRSAIARQGEWVDASSAESMDSNGSRASIDAAPGEPAETSLEQAPVMETASSSEVGEPWPEFVINDSSAQPLPEVASANQAIPAVPVVMVDEQVAPIPTEAIAEAPSFERPPLKLRGTVQQIAGEFPAESSPAKQPKQVAGVRTDRVAAASPPRKQTEPTQDVVRHVPAVNVDAITIEDGAGENPVQRFPVQRVLRLRQRIESATALNPGASNQSVPKASAATTSTKSEQQPSVWNTVDREAAVVDRPEQVQTAWAEDPPVQRPAVKVRERVPVTDSLIESVPNSSKVKVKSSPSVRQKVVGRSSMMPWVSAGQTTTGKAESSKTSQSDFQPATSDQPRIAVPSSRQPALEAPISQVGYEPSVATAGIDVASIGDKVETKRGAAEQIDIAPPPPVAEEKDNWIEDSLVRKRAVSSATVNSSSFGLIDRLAYGLNLPASTVVSLIGGGGLLLIGIGLVVVRAALRKRHSA